MREIKLRNRNFSTFVDDEYFEKLRNYPWRLSKQGYVIAYDKTTKRHLRLHRVITGAKTGELVDHINNNPLDNRKSNLRICGDYGNARNKSIHKNNRTGYKGIHLIPSSGRYRAHIMVNRKYFHLGMYSTPEEAAHAYDKAAIEYFGEFAKLNFASHE